MHYDETTVAILDTVGGCVTHDANVPAEILRVRTEGNWEMSELEGVHVGYSTGANVWSAVHLAERLHEAGQGGCVVTIACDRSDRYSRR